MDHYALIGNPVNHSLSPLVHKLFAEQTNQQMTYQLILAELDALDSAILDFQRKGGKGLNITMPFKHRAFGLVNEHSERSIIAKSVNTILFHNDESRYGDNTDGTGLVRDLMHNLNVTIRNKHILILGAGGAVRGIIDPLLQEQPAMIILANRTENKVFELAAEFVERGPIQASTLANLSRYHFDLVVNGTSASLQGEAIDWPKNILSQETYCYDMVYGKGLTPFLHWAKTQGTRFTDGLGMLVEQAAESFYLWREIKPDTQPILTALRENVLIS